ncbi:hypothetical protein CDCA_CDCA14G3887 [Cyanidium caldarium]|uniref:VOC domain-containing protein n=1 Tax=Cyanidium caldarium TaxID=2771 RepID=A0AAV9IZX5_CYACA|nr:hypothetical protein CDCA_CDCA14G3887 [Cyanidium caldarium]
MGLQGACLDHVALNVQDVERAITFYTQVMGMEGLRLEEWRGGKVPFPSVRVSSTTIIDLFPGEMGGAADGQAPVGNHLNHFCLALSAAEHAQVCQRLETAGYAPTGPPARRWGARGMATALYFHDPDGNMIELRHYPEDGA